MSQKQSACIPPPLDYTPKTRPPNAGNFRERGNKRGHHHHHNHDRRHLQHQPTTFLRDQPDLVEPPKPQIRDKFHRNEDDDYFARVQDDEEEEEEEKEQDKRENTKTSEENAVEDDEDDPLDAYMRSLEGETSEKNANKSPIQASQQDDGSQEGHDTKRPQSSGANTTTQESDKRGVRLDIDGADDVEESYYKFLEQKQATSATGDPDEFEEAQNLVEYDQEGNIISVARQKREVDPLPPVDHSTINYEPFQRAFYQEHSEIHKLTPEQGNELRSKLEIKVSGNSPPKPVCSFAHFSFDEKLMRVIRRSEYTQPTPIQAQAIPAALSGRNVIGIAMTGSGKTAAYIWPMIVHIMGQSDLKQGDGPIGLILVPTRELALQVYSEAKKFCNSYKLSVVCAYGGGSKYEQSKDLEAGAEIVVATPGRIIDLIKSSVTNLRRVTYLVLDEADRFFEMGFEVQVRSICDQIRPDRQTLLFSATFKHRIEQLARTVTEDPVKIVQKTIGEANNDVTQHVAILPEASKKWHWLLDRLVEFTSSGSVLIFVTRIINSEELYKNLSERGTEALLLHGDMEQSERNRVITSFKRKDKDIMIATDVAARGLDISHIRTVINYDAARDIDTHIHRVGRTGRAGCKGDAHTLLTDKDKEFAGHLVKNLESSNQPVEDNLLKLAMQSHNFRKSRNQNKSGRDGHHHHHHHQHRHQSHSRDGHRHPSDVRHDSRDRGFHKQHSDNYSHWDSEHQMNRQRSHGSREGHHQSDESHRRGSTSHSSYHDDRKRSRWH